MSFAPKIVVVGSVDEVPLSHWKNLSADFRKILKVAYLKKCHYLLKQIHYILNVYVYIFIQSRVSRFLKMTKAIDAKGDFLVRNKEMESERVINGSFKI